MHGLKQASGLPRPLRFAFPHGLLFSGILLAALFSSTAHALVVAPRDIYEGEIIVDPLKQPSRDELLAQAMGQVIVRVSGDRNAITKKAVQDLQANAVRYVQAFGFTRRPAPPPPKNPTTIAPAVNIPSVTPPKDIQIFRAKFDAGVLNTQLRNAGLSVWGRERPSTLMWVSVQAATGRWLVTDDIAASDAPMLSQAALYRGVPIIIPAPASGVEAADIAQGAAARIVSASRGYGAGRIVTGYVTQSGQAWSGNWTLFEQERPSQNWKVTAPTLDETLAAGIDQIADYYASRNTTLATAGNRTVVRASVSGITNVGDYARIAQYLSSLSTVSSVSLLEVSGDSVLYRLNLQGDVGVLQQAIALGRVLSEDRPADEGGDTVLHYRLSDKVQP